MLHPLGLLSEGQSPEFSKTAASFGRNNLIAALIIAALFLLKYSILMNDSYIYGRLAMPPLYDDVTYFVDGLRRLQAFRHGGLTAAIASALSNPPHAPLSTLAAAVGFGIFGPHPVAAYLMNAVALWAITVLFLTLWRAGPLLSCAFSLALICTAWFDSSITYFHPDLVTGYGAAVVASALVCQVTVLTSWKRVAAVGILAGLVLLGKPAAFVPILALFGVATVCGAAVGILARRPFSAMIRGLGLGFGLTVILSGTYYVYTIRALVLYMRAGLVEQREVWDRHLSSRENLYWFLDQASDQLGIWIILAAVLLFIALAFAYIKWDRITLAELGGLSVCAVLGYIMPTVSTMKTMLFGMFLYGMLITTPVVAAIYLSKLKIALQHRKLINGSMMAAVAIFGLFTFADHQGVFPAWMRTDAADEYKGVSTFIAQQREIVEEANPQASEKFTCFSPLLIDVPSEAFVFRALKEGNDLTISHYEMETDIKKVLSDAALADVAVLPDDQLLKSIFKYKINDHIPEIRDALPAMGFVEKGQISLSRGRVLLYARETEHR